MPVLRSPFAGVDLPAGDVDPDYLYFLEHIRLDGDAYALELPAHGDSPASLLKYEAPLASSSDGECVSDPSPGRLSSNRRAVEERESSDSASLETAPACAWYDSLDDVDEDYRLFLQHTSLVDGQLVLEIGGVVVNYDEPVAAVFRGEKDTRRGGGAAFASPGEGVGVAAVSDEVGSGAPSPVVSEHYACDWRADQPPRRVANGGGDERLSDANSLKQGAYREASSSGGRRAPHPTNSRGRVEKERGRVENELGVIWPTHITRRPDSDFKQRLIEVLTKPVAPKEYFRLFETVTTRTPLMKLRQVRNETKFYPTEEMGSSYLDYYPDLADQIMNSGRRNGLALMRGFLFWLQNTVHEDQFKPWVDDSKEQEVIFLVD